MNNLDENIRSAAKNFWEIRHIQGAKQKASGKTDAGSRSAVTGGKQMDGFEKIAIDMALDAGIKESSIFQAKSLELPGYFRPTKKWDLLIVEDNQLIAAVEFKSQVGPSFGNNFNNRLEESLGSATDLWTAYREGAFGTSLRPWLGYLFVLEDCDKSNTPVKVSEPHFKVFPEFNGASYSKRYEILIRKLLLERHYNGASLLMTRKDPFDVSTPNNDLGPKHFYVQFQAHLRAYADERR